LIGIVFGGFALVNVKKEYTCGDLTSGNHQNSFLKNLIGIVFAL
tara:strand:+ start:1036 stop:1167 length:132 start_codon:yes stop_codon:yes gene_type:complete